MGLLTGLVITNFRISQSGNLVMFSKRLYFLSEFLILFKQGRLHLAADDIDERLNDVCYLYDQCMVSNDQRVSPSGITEYFILAYHCPEHGNKITGYQVFFATKQHCELFEVYVSNAHRRQGIATTLIRESIEWATLRGITKFSLKLVECDGKENPLIHFFNKLVEEVENRCSFYFK